MDGVARTPVGPDRTAADLVKKRAVLVDAPHPRRLSAPTIPMTDELLIPDTILAGHYCQQQDQIVVHCAKFAFVATVVFAWAMPEIANLRDKRRPPPSAVHRHTWR